MTNPGRLMLWMAYSPLLEQEMLALLSVNTFVDGL
jgi:hypothetical protein